MFLAVIVILIIVEKIENYIAKDIGFKKDSFHTTGMLVLYNNMFNCPLSSDI
jgi:hypothetical protein